MSFLFLEWWIASSVVTLLPRNDGGGCVIARSAKHDKAIHSKKRQFYLVRNAETKQSTLLRHCEPLAARQSINKKINEIIWKNPNIQKYTLSTPNLIYLMFITLQISGLLCRYTPRNDGEFFEYIASLATPNRYTHYNDRKMPLN
jgi:hypothetical protein